jgi:hypothetical protein
MTPRRLSPRRWWHLAWTLPIATAASGPLSGFAVFSWAATQHHDVVHTVVFVTIVGALFFAAGVVVPQVSWRRRVVVGAVAAGVVVVLEWAALLVISGGL